MANYSFQNLEEDLVRNPSLAKPILSFIENIMGTNFKKFAAGKNATEFSNALMLVIDVPIPQEMAKFLAYHLHPFIQQDPDFVLKKIRKLNTEKNGRKIARLLQTVLDSKRRTSLVKKTSVTAKPKSLWGNRVKTLMSGKKVIGQKMRTIMQNGSGVAKNILRGSTFASSSSPIKKEKTILSTKSPLRDGELENLRVQTLVSFQASKNVLTWVRIPNEKELLKARPADFFKILKSISLMTSLTKEQRQFLSSLKSILMIRANLLLQEEIIVNIINQGIKSYNHTLNRLSSICTNRYINRKIWDYLAISTEKRIKRHHDIFKQQFERVLTSDDLETLLKKYPLLSKTVVKKYRELMIIKNIHHVYDNYQKYPNKLTNIMNKYLGVHGEANIKNKLQQVLLTNTSDMSIFQSVKNEKSILTLIRRLESLKNNREHQDTVNKVLELLNSFLQSDNRINFSGFRASLNFLSPPLVKKIEHLMRQHLTTDLNKDVKKLLASKTDYFTNFQGLIKVFKNPRYQYADIQIFEMSPLVLADKMNNLQSSSNQLRRSIDYAFPYPQFPKSFRSLLEKAKEQEASLEEKNISNFCRELENIETKVKKRQIVLIKNEIIDLFTSYGNINFSDVSSTDFLNGYAIARTIREYYSNPNRVQIELSYKIISEVRDKVKKMIDEERARQLQKL